MTIPLDRWPEVERWLLAAMDFPDEAREAFLREYCPPDLQSIVTRLIRGLETADSPDSDWLDETRIQESVASVAERFEARDMDRGPVDHHMTHIGSYTILSELGHGGMGIVHLCERQRPGNSAPDRAAIKILRPDLLQEDAILRFRRERVLLAAIDSPHVPKLLDAGTAPDGRPYFVMERVDGEPISEYVRRRDLSLQDRLNLFDEACSAVQAVHDHMIVHRDIKPSNLFVSTADGTSDGTPGGTPGGTPTVKILDFGVATVNQEGIQDESPSLFNLTQENTSPFTPAFAAPEQLAGRPTSTAVDIYALGILLCLLVTDKPAQPYPFCGGTGTCALDPVCSCASHVDPDCRFESVSDLRQAVRALHLSA